MLIINPRGIGPEGIDMSGDLPPEVVGLAEPTLRFSAPVVYRLRIDAAGPDLVVHGRVETVCETVCDRCAESFRLGIVVDSFLHVVAGGVRLESVDLTPQIREDMILALPHKTLCRAECRGLCPMCGANRNEGSCGCEPGGGETPWQALDSLDLSEDL